VNYKTEGWELVPEPGSTKLVPWQPYMYSYINRTKVGLSFTQFWRPCV